MTRSNHPAPGHGWQATPGQPMPRAVRQPAANGLLLVMPALVWFSPLSILAWLLGQAVMLLQRRWHWWRLILAALAWIGLVLAVTGPQDALRRHVFVLQHLWQYVALHFGYGPPGTEITISQFLWDLVATQVWLAVPVGLLAASLSVWNVERAAGGAEWSPFVRRRQRIDQHARDRRTARLLARPRDHKLTAPALGIALDGDLASWRQGRYVVPPAQLRGKAMAVVGAPGAGKTVTLLRLAYLAGLLGRKVCFVDCKGTDPTLVLGADRCLPARQPPGAGRLLAPERDGHVAGHPGPGPEPAAGGRAVHRAVLPARRLRRPPPGPHRPRHAAGRGQRRAAAAPGRGRAGGPMGGPSAAAEGHRGHRRPPPRRAAAVRRFLRCPRRCLRPRYLVVRGRRSGRPHRPHPALQGGGGCGHAGGAGGLRPLRHRPQAPPGRGRPAGSGRIQRPGLGRRQRHQPDRAAAGRRRPGRGRRPERRRPGRPPPGPAAAGQLRRRDRPAAVPGPRAAHRAGGAGAGAGAQLGAGLLRPPRAGQGPHGGAAPHRPEQVRQAQPGEAWVIQAGQSIHLRVLPPPTVAPEPVELAAALPLADDTVPLPAAEEPAPVGLAAAVALVDRMLRRAGQRVGRRRERAGRLPSPARRAWLPGRPLPGRGRR